MKNSLKTKSSVEKAKIYKIAGGLINLLQLKNRLRQSVSVLLITTMLLTTLFIDLDTFKAWAQGGSCGFGQNYIFQGCPLGAQFQTELTNQAVDDVLEFYKLPASERANVMKYARNEVRGMIYKRLIALANKPDRTPAETAALDAFGGRIKEYRINSALAARNEYHRWQQNACNGYTPPGGFTYLSSGCSFYTIVLNGTPRSPTFEEFQQFGTSIAYQGLFTTEGVGVTNGTANQIAMGAGAAAVGIAGVVGAQIGSTITIGSLSFLFPYLYGQAQFGAVLVYITNGTVTSVYLQAPAAPTVASGTIGGAAVGGAAAVILAAALILAMQTVNVVNQAQIPDKLDQAVIDQQNSYINVPALVTTEAGRAEFYSVFLLDTLPDYPGEAPPAPTPQDRKFVVQQIGSGTATEQQFLNFYGAPNQPRRLRLNGNWFVEQNGSVENQVLTINYIDWTGRPRTAARLGDGRFLVSDPLNPNNTSVDDEILYAGTDGKKYSAKLKFTDIAVLSREAIQTGCVFANPQNGTDEIIATVAEAGEPASGLTAIVNGGQSATVNNITVRNLTIDSDYNVHANVVNRDADAPSIAEFTLAVRNTVGQTVSAPFKIKKTGIATLLPSSIPRDAEVGTPYQATIGSRLELGCGSGGAATYSITGNLPLGLKIEPDPLVASIYLKGTPQSGGHFVFTITKSYGSGESTSQIYDLIVDSEMTTLDDGAVSWWRGEGNPSDHFNRANGTMVGNVGYEIGRVGYGFNFDGSNSYVALPANTFSPANNFTFETWFKTAAPGVILGGQRSGDPYGNSSGASPIIYVNHEGKLRVQMFKDQNNSFVTSQNRIDNNEFHHLAVTYEPQFLRRTVYLDGVSIGTAIGNVAASFQNYQFGTGYVADTGGGGADGWLNFTGMLDEPTLYNRVLTPTEIGKIIAAGQAGKLSVKIRSYPPEQRDGTNGGIIIQAQGGAPPLRYSIDGGNTFATTGTFENLTAGTYNVVIEDLNGFRYTETVIVRNQSPTLTLTTAAVSPSCFGKNDGSISIYPGGTTGQTEFSVLGGANTQSSGYFPNLFGGVYTPWIYDINSQTSYTGENITLTQPAQFALSPGAFPNAQQNVPFSQTFTLSGNTAPYTFTAQGFNINTNYDLPTGLSATVAPNQITISGTPTAAGIYPIRIQYFDQRGCQDSKTMNLNVVAAGNVSIGGRVTNGGQGLPNATVTLGGGASQTTMTDSAGNYTFNNVPQNQNYTATVALAGYTFAQTSLTLNNVGANVGDADFTTAFTHYEGDIAPRSTGDGNVDVRDYVMLNRIMTNQEAMPAVGGEWQRASVAPRSTLGSTSLQPADLTQVLRYIIRFNPLTLVGGPSAPASSFAESERGKYSGREMLSFGNTEKSALKIESPNLVAPATVSAATVAYTNGTVSVPINLSSDGNAVAAQFTITYDDSKLFLTSVGSAGDSNNLYSINKDVSGKVNVVAFRNGLGNFPTETALLRLNFTVNQGATGSALIDFVDTPTQRIATDSTANTIMLNSSAGRVLISQPTAAGVSIAGRVFSSSGRAVSRARVFITMPDGSVRSTFTGSFGFYHFQDIPAGATYVLSVEHKRYVFNPQVINLTEAVENFDFTAVNNQ